MGGKLGMSNQGSQNLAKLVQDSPEAAKDWDIMHMVKGPVQKDTGPAIASPCSSRVRGAAGSGGTGAGAYTNVWY